MSKECTVCKKEKPLRVMQFLKPIDDWICDPCLKKGREAGVTDLEDGKKLTAEIRGEKLNGE